VQDRDANKLWLVVVKATFGIRAGGSTYLSDEQAPVLLVPEPVGEAGKSLTYESDLLGVKPCTDILVNGSAWAPGGRRASSVDVQLVAGPIKKRLRVFGDRVWERGLMGTQISPAQTFESMPITYERAYGGWDRSSPDPAEHRMEDRNPVGTGFAARREHCEGLRLPNVEHPDQVISSWKHRPPPAGLNAVDCSWSPRRELAGTYDDQWLEKRFPLWAENFDPRYRNCAPSDQQAPDYFRGGELVDLINLSREGRLTFELPTIHLSLETRFGAERVEHPAQLCTVIVEPNIPCVLVSWQTHLVCNHRVDELDETIVIENT
jgi:hypothetical protein